MRRLSAQNASDANDRVEPPRFGEFLRCHRNFKRSRHAHKFDLALAGSRARKRIERSGQKPVGNEAVKPADYDSKAQAGGVEGALDCDRLEFILSLIHI